MDFNKASTSKSYFTLNEAKEFRSSLWSKVEGIIAIIEDELWVYCDQEKALFIAEKFLDKSVYNLDKIDLIIQTSKNTEEYIIEQEFPKRFENDHINFHLWYGDTHKLYSFEDGFYRDKGIIEFNNKERL